MASGVTGPGGPSGFDPSAFRAAGAEGGQKAGNHKQFGGVKHNAESPSLMGQAGQTTTVPTPPPQHPVGNFSAGKAEEPDKADSKDDEKDEKKADKDDTSADAKEAMKKVSDVDAQKRKQKEKNRFERMKDIAKQQGYQAMVDALWGEGGGEPIEGVEQIGDITDVYDKLAEFKSMAAEGAEAGDVEFAASLTAANTQLLDEHGGDIRAGWLFEKGSELDAYRHHVVHFESVAESFGAIMKQVDGDPELFTRDVDQLISNIKVDSAAGQSTMDPRQLQDINQGLFKLLMCKQMPEDCARILRGIGQEHGVGPYAK